MAVVGVHVRARRARKGPVALIAAVATLGASLFLAPVAAAETVAPGGLLAWGSNSSGQLGTGGTTSASSPVASLAGDVIEIAAGEHHTVALVDDGTGSRVYTWGSNTYGQLGDGNVGVGSNSSTPHHVASLDGATAVAAGGNFSLAVKADGTVWRWGSMTQLNCTPGTTGCDTFTAPEQVQTLAAVTEIAAGRTHALAISRPFEGHARIWSWGNNGSGQLGIGSTSPSMSPVEIVSLSAEFITDIAAGDRHSLALVTNGDNLFGTVYAWGDNTHGQLGDGTTTDRTSPTAIPELDLFEDIDGGIYHTAGVRSGGELWTWGRNAEGQLGTGDTTDRSAPIQISDVAGAEEVAAGGYFTLARYSAGDVIGFGANHSGQLGTGAVSTAPVTTPVSVTGVTAVSQISAGFSHSLAIEAPPVAPDSFTLQAVQSVVPASPTKVPVEHVPMQPASPDIQTAPTSLGSLRLAPTSLGSLRLAPTSLGSLRLAPTSLGSLRLAPAAQSGLGGVPLSSIRIVSGPGWAERLDTTPDNVLEALPLQAITLLDVLSLDPLPSGIQTLELQHLDFSASPFGGIHPLSFVFGFHTPLSAFALPAPGWCERLTGLGFDCGSLTRPDSTDGVLSTSLLELQLAGVPLEPFELPALPLASIDGAALSASPLGAMPVDSVDLHTTAVGSVLAADAPSVVDCARVDCTAGSTARLVDAGDLDPSAILPASGTGGRLRHVLPALTDLSLGELVFGLLPNLDDNPFGSASLEDLGVLDYAGPGSSVVDYRLDLEPSSRHLDATVSVNLPPSFRFVEGSDIVTEGEPTTLVSVDRNGPTASVEGGVVSWDLGDLGASVPVVITFKARPGVVLGTHTASARLTSSAGTADIVDQAPVTVTEAGDAGDTADAATPVESGALHVFHVTPGDRDFYSIEVPKGWRVSARLDHLPADFDLVLYHTPDGAPGVPLRPDPVEGAVPVPEQPVAIGATAEPLAPETLQDIELADLPVAGISDQRGTTSEQVSAVSWGGTGSYLIQVEPYNAGHSATAATLSVHLTPPPPPIVCAPMTFAHDADPYAGADESITGGALPSALPSDVRSLFLVNKNRLHDTFGEVGGVDQSERVIAALEGLTAHPQVGGTVLEIDGAPAVRDAYQAWDADPCDPELANDVVRTINAAVDGLLAGRQGEVENIVLVGSDAMVPMGRIQDLTQGASEALFAGDLVASGESALLAAAAGAYVLSDDPYGDFQPTKVLAGHAYVSDVALGRLLETPDEVVAAANRFIAFDGQLAADTAFTSGYDFMDDMAAEIDPSLEGLTGDTNTGDDLYGGPWTRSDLLERLAEPADILAVNGHFDPLAMQPATGTGPGGSFTLGDLVSASELDGQQLDGRVLFSIGCHSLFPMPDVSIGGVAFDADWSQVMARNGVAGFAGQTAFGLGLSSTVGLSERIMADFAVHLGDSTIGGALTRAKQQYAGRTGQYGVYDLKALAGAGFVGLPMYRVAGLEAAPAATSTPAPAVATDPISGLAAANVSVAPQFSPAPEAVADGGSVWPVAGGDLTSTQQRPILPRLTVDVTSAGRTAIGAMVTGLTSVDTDGFQAAVARPVIDLTATAPDPQFGDVAFPAAIQQVTQHTDDGDARQQLVIHAAHFRGAGLQEGRPVGRLRRFTEVDATVFYRPAGATDGSAPVITRAVGTVVGGTAAFTAEISDPESAVRRANVLYLDESGIWRLAELTRVGNLFVGAGPASGTQVQFQVQALSDGGVATSSNKADLYAVTVPSPAADGITAAIEGAPAPAGNGWLQNGAVVLGGPEGTSFEVAVDGGGFQPYAGPVALGGDGVHVAEYRSSRGDTGVLVAAVDATGPVVDIDAPAGGSYLKDDPQVARYSCADATSGLTGCDGPVPDAAPLDTSTPGSHTFTVTATDAAGNVTTASAGYGVHRYGFEGFFSPLNNGIRNTVKAGRAVPVKWRLPNGDGTDNGDVATVSSITSHAISCSTGVSEDTVEQTAVVGDTILRYDAIGRHFVYNWSTSQSWKGSCRRFTVHFAGGSRRSVDFRFS